jgi:diacylglycerol kinase family enzyme/membrane-associated phospholipid phosphatase
VTGTSARRQVVRALNAWDAEVFRGTAARRSPALDVVLPVLTRAADHSLLWAAIGAGMMATGRRRAHRAARRGLASVAVTSVLTNGIGRRVLARTGPVNLPRLLSRLRRAARVPAFGGLPSRHAASSAAFAVGAGLAEPALAVPLAGLAASVAYARVYTGAHYPGDVLAGAALGVAVGATVRRLAPMHTSSPVRVIEPLPDPQPPRPLGEGVVAVINPRAGGGRGAGLGEEVAHLLPQARVATLSPAGDLVQAMREAAAEAEVLAVVGGDGSVNAAAGVAIEAGLPLLVLPGGTLNHFAADLGLRRVSDAIRALREGTAIRVDVGTIGDAADGAHDGSKVFVNTASLGSYPSFVAKRERWESRLGKRVVAALAIVAVLRTERPLRAVINGREHLLAMLFIGNGRYQPLGFAPSWRPRLDDGILDVRFVEAGHRFAAIRLLGSLATGRLGRSRIYVEAGSAGLRVSLPDGPTALARDGEIGPGPAKLSFGTARRSLTIYRPAVRGFL